MLHKGRKIALHTRGVTQIAFKPDWTPDGKAAPSKRNDRMLDIVPTGVIVFPAPASPATSPTRPSALAFRCSTTARAARKRRFLAALTSE
jgi:hypothetical protein